jgi:hypothetical protein
MKEAAIFAACVRGVLEFPFKCGKTRNGVPMWVDCILPLERQSDPVWDYCCLFSHQHKKIYMERMVINPTFLSIVSFHGNEQVLSVSNCEEMWYQEFNLSCLYKDLQQTSTVT